MLIWSLVMFALGAAAFLDAFFNYGELFRSVNAVLFMLLALGMLVRTSMLMRLQKTEKLLDRTERLLSRNAELENIIIEKENNREENKSSHNVLY